MYWMIFCCRPLFGRGFFVLFLFFFTVYIVSLFFYFRSFSLSVSLVVSFCCFQVLRYPFYFVWHRFSASFLLLKIVGRYNLSQFVKCFVLVCSIKCSGSSGNMWLTRGRIYSFSFCSSRICSANFCCWPHLPCFLQSSCFCWVCSSCST